MDRRLASPLRQEAANPVHACGKTLLGRVLWRAKGTFLGPANPALEQRVALFHHGPRSLSMQLDEKSSGRR